MNTPLISRRKFIQILALTSVGWPLISKAEKLALGLSSDEVYKNLLDPWLSLAEVQEHLFPADKHSPGSRDINALGFLRNMLDTPDMDPEEKSFIVQGVGWLNDLSIKNYKVSFNKLNSDNKEIVLRQIESSRAGSRWLSLMMGYLIEALLSDPVYGGNKEAKGWKWLEHIPGFPTPTTEQVYFKTGYNRHINTRRRTKA